MRIAGAIACLSLLIPSIGSRGKSADNGRIAAPSSWDASATLPYRLQASEFVRKGQLLQAVRIYDQAYNEAIRLGDKHSAVRLLNNVGACRMGLFQLRETMSALLAARRLGEEIGFDPAVIVSSLNLSNLYLHLGSLDAAVQAANRGLSGLPSTEAPLTRIQGLILLGKIRSRQKDMAAAEKRFSEAIALAELSKEFSALGTAWNHLGYEYLENGDLQHAEISLLRAHRILADRKDLKTHLCYVNLGRLYLRKGDLVTASKWMDLAVKASAAGSRELPGWFVHHERGKLRQVQGKHELALEDFRKALDAARLWRLEVVPAAAFRVSSEANVLQNIYDSFLTSGYQVYHSHPSDNLMTELFLASEENRAWSLRQTLREDADSKLPEEYYAMLAEVLAADSKMLKGHAAQEDRAKFNVLRNRLTEMEAAAGLRDASAPTASKDERLAVRSIQSQLRPEEARLSFHVSGESPLLFTLTRRRLTMHPLPPRPVIEASVSGLRDAIDRQSPQMEAAAGNAYQTLLSELPEEVKTKRHWLLALDVGLFELPFAALRSGNSYLVEQHALTLTPYAALHRGQVEPEKVQSFLGFGDPVYNRADARWNGPRQMFGNLWASREMFELPRLPGSGREIERCGRLVNGDAVLVKGNEATAERLNSELRRDPAFIHIATHVVPSKADPGQALIALSLNGNGISSLLSRDSIAALRTNAAVVTMSGCGSGLGPSLPGAGLMGLTRAWLEAGAHSVAASLWPVPDDNGELLVSFYKALRSKNTSASSALQTAQLESLRSGSWRANPRYWASYFIAGKD